MSTERYDGKTRKDDIRKWTLIISAVVIVFIAIQIGLHFLKKQTAPDYTVVDLCYGTIREETQEHIKRVVGEVVGDKNGNGNVNVSVKSLLPDYMGGYEENAAPLFAGDYVLFFMTDPSPWEGDLIAEVIDLEGTALYNEYVQFGNGVEFYACILNTKDKDMEEAHRIVDAFLNEEVEDSALESGA